jgi:hypothetical protein
MIRDDFLQWKIEQPAFTNDEVYFRDKFGVTITPFCKCLFNELMDMQKKLGDLQAAVNYLRQEIE